MHAAAVLIVLSPDEKRNSVVDKGQVELHAGAFEEVASTTCYLCPALEISDIGHGNEIDVAEPGYVLNKTWRESRDSRRGEWIMAVLTACAPALDDLPRTYARSC